MSKKSKRYKGKLNTKNETPFVSDHAVLRYLERKKGMNIKKIRNEILTPDVESAIRAGALSITIDGMKFAIINKVITTCIN